MNGTAAAGGRGHAGRGKAGGQLDLTRVMMGAVSTLLWMLCSSALIIMNKNLYRWGG